MKIRKKQLNPAPFSNENSAENKYLTLFQCMKRCWVNLANFSYNIDQNDQKWLTFLVNRATMVLQYTGIVVYPVVEFGKAPTAQKSSDFGVFRSERDNNKGFTKPVINSKFHYRVYSAGHYSITPLGKEAQPNQSQLPLRLDRSEASARRAEADKKQKQSNLDQNSQIALNQLLAGFVARSGDSASTAATKVDQLNIASLGLFATFCFLCERLFYFLDAQLNKNKSRINYTRLAFGSPKRTKTKTKIEHKHDSRLLSATRHTSRNRSQQDHCYSLGRRGINPYCPKRQQGLALLYQKTSRRNSSTGQGDQLLPPFNRQIENKQKGTREIQLLKRKNFRQRCCTIDKISRGRATSHGSLDLLSFLIGKVSSCKLLTTNYKLLTKKYDRWSLQNERYFARNRSQQNHLDSLGGRGINSQSSSRQQRVALLYPRSSQHHFGIGQKNQLLPKCGSGLIFRFRFLCNHSQLFAKASLR